VITLGLLPDAPLGVAVSGGGDSVALLLLLHKAKYSLRVATVDHRLRPEAAAEALGVAKLCAKLGLPHEVLAWEMPDFKGNLQKAAREARRGLLAAWAQGHGLRDIVLGHTQDDQAETVLMRLARGSGVDGLAGMAAKRCEGGLCWHRPMLHLRRAELRAYLSEAGVGWVDDPSNDDLKYDRIKARQALDVLAPLGLGTVKLAETAAHMRRARAALEVATQDLARRCVKVSDAGEMVLQGLEAAPREVQLRLLAGALGWVAGAGYRPRFAALEGVLESCLGSAAFGKTLHDCHISRRKNEIVINREVAATPAVGPVENIWDTRWEINLKDTNKLQFRALGEDGLQYCTQWRDSGHSRAALLASPSFWQGGLLQAAPLAYFGDIMGVKLVSGEKGFYDALITH
jgi:tRNA(Ile)-lysidine synthase